MTHTIIKKSYFNTYWKAEDSFYAFFCEQKTKNFFEDYLNFVVINTRVYVNPNQAFISLWPNQNTKYLETVDFDSEIPVITVIKDRVMYTKEEYISILLKCSTCGNNVLDINQWATVATLLRLGGDLAVHAYLKAIGFKIHLTFADSSGTIIINEDA